MYITFLVFSKASQIKKLHIRPLHCYFVWYFEKTWTGLTHESPDQVLFMTWAKISIHEINQISTLTVSWKHKVHNAKFKLKSWRFNQNPDMWCAMEGGSYSAIQDAWCCQEILSFITCSSSPVNGPYCQQF